MVAVDPAQLECFLALAEELHFGRTAERLRISNSRVSQLVGALEQRVGGRLFERTSRSVRLTRTGEQLRAELAPAYGQLQSVLERARRANTTVTGTLRVGQQGTGANELTGDILREFADLRPGWDVRPVELDFSNQLTALRERTVDLALARLPVQEDDITVGPVVISERRALAVSSRHPLAQREEIVLDDIAGEYVFDLPDTSPAYWRDFHVPRQTTNGTPLRRRQVVATPNEILALIGAGQGVSPMVESMRRYYARADIAYVPITDMPRSDVALVWLTRNNASEVLAFAAAVAAAVQRHGGPLA